MVASPSRSLLRETRFVEFQLQFWGVKVIRGTESVKDKLTKKVLEAQPFFGITAKM